MGTSASTCSTPPPTSSEPHLHLHRQNHLNNQQQRTSQPPQLPEICVSATPSAAGIAPDSSASLCKGTYLAVSDSDSISATTVDTRRPTVSISEMAKRQSVPTEDRRCLVRMNKVAPVIIKHCREEFQDVSDFKHSVVTGSIGDGMPEHPLIKGSCFLVNEVSERVDKLGTLKTLKTPNFHRVSHTSPIYASGQPSADGLQAVLQKMSKDGHKVTFIFSVRQEPVLFLRAQEDFIPYSLRHGDKLCRLYYSDLTPLQADENEAAVRKEILDLASLGENNCFYVYAESDSERDLLTLEPRMVTLTVEDHLVTSTELYHNQTFAKSNLRYYRLSFPQNRAPSDETVEDFLQPFKENPELFDKADLPFPALYFVCATGKGRCTLAKTMACLLFAHIRGFPSDLSQTTDSSGQYHDVGKLKAVQLMLSEIENRWIVKQQVDWAVEQCSEVMSLTKCILETKARLGAVSTKNITETHQRNHLYRLCQEYTERYCFLLCFNAYLQEQVSQRLCVSYSRWLKRHPTLVAVLCNLDLSKHTEPASLISTGLRCLVADNYIGLDVLSSRMDVKVANFRRLMGLPVYGMAQPARDGLSRVVNFLLHKKQGCSQVVIINLRNDLAIEFDEATYHVEDAARLGEPVLICGASGKDMEVCEEALLKEFKGKKSVTVYEEISSPPVSKAFNSALTPDDLWQQQRLQTLDMSYVRLPIQYDHGFQEKEYDAILQLLSGYLNTDASWKEDNHAFVFHCRTGKSRSSLAMAAAGLLFYHARGFPYGARPGEQELVSCPNRSYTLGEFEVVMRLVRCLPQGYQRKREVDFVLDRLFETMSPMHFHLREVIFVTYNKIKSANSDVERQELRRHSVDLLERYMYLILFNTYLAHRHENRFQTAFSQWMQEVASEAGVYDILDNLCFKGLEDPTSAIYSTRQERWTARHANVPFYGQYV